MNPHFVFNVLGSLQNKILQKDPVEANRHLVNLSTLIRRFLESTVNSNIDRSGVKIVEHSIAKEIELLRLYIEFEQLQHEGLFQYSIAVDESVDVQNTLIPPMILQPFVENAIKHGIMHKNGQGQLNIRIRSENTALSFTIEDDGVGREAAKAIKEKSIGGHRSLGTQLVEERIALLNKMGYHIDLKVYDKEGGGTIVELKMKSE
jgi:sensor histidine kinase YesM